MRGDPPARPADRLTRRVVPCSNLCALRPPGQRRDCDPRPSLLATPGGHLRRRDALANASALHPGRDRRWRRRSGSPAQRSSPMLGPLGVARYPSAAAGPRPWDILAGACIVTPRGRPRPDRSRDHGHRFRRLDGPADLRPTHSRDRELRALARHTGDPGVRLGRADSGADLRACRGSGGRLAAAAPRTACGRAVAGEKRSQGSRAGLSGRGYAPTRGPRPLRSGRHTRAAIRARRRRLTVRTRNTIRAIVTHQRTISNQTTSLAPQRNRTDTRSGPPIGPAVNPGSIRRLR